MAVRWSKNAISGHPHRVFYGVLLLTAITWGALGALAASGYPGAPSACRFSGGCWCETPTSGWVREPWNTWSNLPVFACALLMARLARDEGGLGPAVDRPLAIAFSYALWVQGTGALFFHASLSQWSRLVDASSVLCVWGVVVTSCLIRLGMLPARFLKQCVALTTVLAFAYHGWLGLPIDPVGLTCLLSTVGMEFVLARRRKRPSWPLRGSLICLAVSMFLWQSTHPQGFLCGVLPGHALWHFGMSFTVFLFGLHAITSSVVPAAGSARARALR